MSGNTLADNLRPSVDVVLKENRQLVCDDVDDSTQLASSLSGLSQASDDRVDCGESLARKSSGEKLLSVSAVVAVGNEEDGRVATGKDREARSSDELVYNGHQNQLSVKNATEEHQPVDNRQQWASITTVDDHYAIDHRHNVDMEPANAVSPYIHPAGGDAAVNCDIELQLSTARSRTFEHTSYKDDFTELSTNHGTHSATQSRC